MRPSAAEGADKYIMVVGEEGALPDSWILPGYEHIQELGAGAGGHVWLARHQATGMPVAVKYLVPGLHMSRDFREAYRSEAQLLAELDSPHVTRLYEYVEGPPGAAIVMEAIEGSTLRALLKQEGATSPEAALCVLKGSLLGLAAAHESGVVHRDFKPANVLVTPEGVSKLVDFGIAARTGAEVPAAGTPLYMAPEQFHGEPASPASDVYAATATFFECVTGERPYPGNNAVELMAQHSLGNIPDDLAPPPLRALIRKGMAKEPGERPASAREFVDRLEEVAGTAYGPDWEERGQHKLATLIALLPLLLLRGGSQAAVPSSTTSVATTVFGETPLTVTVAPNPPGEEAHHGREHHHRRSLRKSIGAGVAGLVTVILVGAAAAYIAHKPAHPNTDSAASTGATTLITPGMTVAVTQAAATPSVSASPTPSASASTSAAATETAAGPAQTGTATVAATTRTTTAAPTTSATTSSAPPTPAISGLSVTQLGCSSTYTLDASVNVTSNGMGGTLTLNWFYADPSTGGRDSAGSTTYTVPSGSDSQTFSISGGNFANDQAASSTEWGVTVSSTPSATSGSTTKSIDPVITTGCFPVIQ